MKKLTPQEIEKITQAAMKELGPSATPEKIHQIVADVVSELERGAPSITLSPEKISSEGKVIVTAFGKNQPGILFQITKALFELNFDIQDVSQKIVQDFFTLIIIVDISKSAGDFNQLKTRLTQTGEQLGVRVFVQHEDIFKSMYRV